MEQLLTHFTKSKHCFGCEFGKMQKSPAYRKPTDVAALPDSARPDAGVPILKEPKEELEIDNADGVAYKGRPSRRDHRDW